MRGFSLIELLVTVAVLAILSSLAMPSFTTFLKNGRLASETNSLITDLAYARAEAARRGKRVTVCVSTNGTSCGSGSAWAGGRIVFLDGSTAGAVDGSDEVFRYKQSDAGPSVTVTTSGFNNVLNYVQFKPDGSITSLANGQFKICDDRAGNFGRLIQVLASGRAVLTSTSSSCP